MKTLPDESAALGTQVVQLNTAERRILADCRLLLATLEERAAGQPCRIGPTPYTPQNLAGLALCLDHLWRSSIPEDASPATKQKKRPGRKPNRPKAP